MRTARSRSFELLGFKSIMRLLRTYPIRTIARVVSRFSTNFVAVPAFNRVEPVKISGPRSGAITRVGLQPDGIATYGLKQSRMVAAPRRLAARMAPQTNGVRP